MSRGEEGRACTDHELNGPRGHLDQRGAQLGETKTANDEPLKCCETSVRRVATYSEDKEQPGLCIGQCLPHLTRLEGLSLESGSVAFDALNHTHLLVLGEELGRGGVVGQKKKYHDTPSDSNAAPDEEGISPARQSAMDVSDAEACDASNDVTESGATDPDA